MEWRDTWKSGQSTECQLWKIPRTTSASSSVSVETHLAKKENIASVPLYKPNGKVEEEPPPSIDVLV
jgi:hypothetical protein